MILTMIVKGIVSYIPINIPLFMPIIRLGYGDFLNLGISKTMAFNMFQFQY